MKDEEEMVINKDNIIKWIFTLAFILLGAQLLFMGLIKGGRWDLYEQIAMADRAIHGQGQIYYATDKDSYLTTSPYFPGVSFLTIIASKISYAHRDLLMLVLASLIGTTFLFMLAKISQRMGAGANLSYLLVLAFAANSFNLWKMYMTEFKPDTIILLLTTAILYFLVNISEKKRLLLNQLGIFIALIVIGIFKQQAIAIYIGTFLIALFYRKIELKQKILLVLNSSLAGLIVLGIILSVPNCFYITIQCMSKHPLIGLKNSLIMFGDFLKTSWIFILPLIFYFVNLFKKKFQGMSKFEEIWLFCCIPWVFLSLASAVKVGGNAGNIEVGVLVFMPFVIITIFNLVKNIKFLEYLEIIALIVMFISLINPPKHLFFRYLDKVKEDQQVINYLKANFKGKATLHNGDVYMEIERAGLESKGEIDNITGIFGAGKHDLSEFYTEIKNKKYDLIYCSFPFLALDDKSFGEKILTSYRSLNDKNMPEILKNKLFVRK